MSGDANKDPVLIAGRYRLLNALGQGGMGVVWRAYDESLNREVAVKEVRAPRHLDDREVQRLYTRLEREGWAAARISHRNVVTVYDVATHDGRPWIVMELVKGLSLADVLEAGGPLPPARAARIGAEVLAALRSAHEAGVLHRDVKPGNILIGNDGRVVLTDFGIAMIEGGSALTVTGEVIGSPEFLAPERALGRTPGPPSDLWSLGVTLYAAVEGISPFRRDTALSTLRAVVDEELRPPARAGALTGVIDGLLRKDPDGRTTAEEAERQLRIVAAGGEPRPDTRGAGRGPTTVADRPAATPSSGPAAGAYPPTAPYGPGTTATTPLSAGAAGADDARGRRAGLVLAVGALALALGAGGIAWALLHDGDGNGSDNGGYQGATTGGDAGASAGGTQDTPTDDPTEEPSTSPSPSVSQEAAGQTTTKPPALVVHVSVTAVRAEYSGVCPPPENQAPAFTGSIEVNRIPAQVTYRWVTKSGKGGSDWKTASFDSGLYEVNPEAVVTAYTEGGAYQDEIALQVKSPAATSEYVLFSTTCETDRPTVSPEAGG
ncbi:Serine/threonine-protein kinase PknD [Streptomyces sp. RB5]|uniref:non-specific serine/threonine protein kinase n=1 Tax=Streptomyces smaragdinus TaxID=2585196 RepID=A0A7K0CIA4_9ACTN|nr:serine/threonine-protein kinase [Streptomyces smaragdinus]MQY13211.1 Serine/threonine-protein kinase PknD [Streptomyces smaragdinus]